MQANEFDKALAEAGTALDHLAASRALQDRLRGRLAGSLRAAPRAPASFGLRPAWAAAVLVAFALGMWLRPLLRSPSPSPPRLGGLALAEASADLQVTVGPGDRVAVLGGRCRLLDPGTGMALELGKDVALRRERAGLRLVAGRVEVAVEKRPAGQPVRMLVSDGAIEVTGTRFTVVQEAVGGRVTLHEGRIDFTAADGRTVRLAPGDSLAWPLPPPAPPAPPPAPSEAPSAPAPAPARPPSHLAPRPAPDPTPSEVSATLERIAALRSRGEYGEAAEVLRRALAEGLRPESDELLSYELGSILAHQLHDPAAACAHWERHLERHRGGRFDGEVEESRAALGCARRSR